MALALGVDFDGATGEPVYGSRTDRGDVTPDTFVICPQIMVRARPMSLRRRATERPPGSACDRCVR